VYVPTVFLFITNDDQVPLSQYYDRFITMAKLFTSLMVKQSVVAKLQPHFGPALADVIPRIKELIRLITHLGVLEQQGHNPDSQES
jgi:hypothetical protein